MTRGRRGFSLMEALIAVVILGATAGGLSTLLVESGRQARDAGKLSYRAAVLNAEISRVAAVPAGELPDTTVTRTVTALQFAYTLTTVASTSGATQTVVITLTPTGPNPIGPLTRTVTRKAGSSNPFNP